MSEAKDIYERMSSIMAEVGAIKKSEKNSHQGWAFRGIDTIYKNVQSIFAKHKVIPGAEIINYDQKEVTSNRGAQGYYITAHIRVWFKCSNGEHFCDTIATTTDYGDKAGGQVMSMAMKKAIIDVLLIPANEPDPDKEIKEMVKVSQIPRWDVEKISSIYKGVNGNKITLPTKEGGNKVWLITDEQKSELENFAKKHELAYE